MVETIKSKQQQDEENKTTIILLGCLILVIAVIAFILNMNAEQGRLEDCKYCSMHNYSIEACKYRFPTNDSRTTCDKYFADHGLKVNYNQG